MSKQDSLYTDFSNLVQEHERLIYKVCSLYTEDSEDRKDLFQEIVLQAWVSFPRFNQASKVSTWLYRVALNTALTHKRKKQKHITVNSDDAFHYIADTAEGSYAEEYKIMHRLIGDLPALEKAMVLLYLEDHSYQEIADIIGLSATNVGTKLARIKEKLKKQATPLVNN